MSYIPFGYLEGFLGCIAQRRDLVEVLTYRDLDWAGDWDYRSGYPREKQAWIESLRSGRRDPRKIYVLLQHDVDSAPERTIDALRVEETLGLRSNVMVFNRRVDRRHLRDTGDLRYTPYIEDRSYLKSLEGKGFVIAYHCNAYEQARFSRPRAQEILARDIAELGRDFAMDFMSAHGGPPDSEGKSNNSLELPRDLEKRIRWVHNGYGIFVDGAYSDGGINSGKRAADKFNLRGFVSTMRPGGRYRILIHPQYYSRDVDTNPRLRSAWYDDVLRSYASVPPRNVWDNTSFESRPLAGRERPWAWWIKDMAQRMTRR